MISSQLPHRMLLLTHLAESPLNLICIFLSPTARTQSLRYIPLPPPLSHWQTLKLIIYAHASCHVLTCRLSITAHISVTLRLSSPACASDNALIVSLSSC